MLLPLFSYTPSAKKSCSYYRIGVPKYIAIVVVSTALLVFLALRVKRINFPYSNDNEMLPKTNNSAAVSGIDSLSSPAAEKLDPPPPPTANEPLLGEVRGPDTIVIPHIPQRFKIVGMVFYGRKDRVEILDCYLKVKAYKELYGMDEKLIA